MRTGTRRPSALRADLLVAGGGLGGVAAALAAARRGTRVILTEESDWLGGQMTTQSAPPDEHRWIEHEGAPASYRRLRREIRSLVRRWYPLSEAARRQRFLNPGGGWVSRLCVEPWLAQAAIRGLLAPEIARGTITFVPNSRPVAAALDRDEIVGVTFEHEDLGRLDISADFVLDATEEGDLLPLAQVEYVTGFESSDDTGEPSAPSDRQPTNMQAITHAFAVDHRNGEDHTIDRPLTYERWRAFRPPFWPGPFLGWTYPSPRTLLPTYASFVPNPDSAADRIRAHSGDRPGDRDLWRFRRIVSRRQLAGDVTSDVTIVNWPMNDYFEAPVTDQPVALREAGLLAARELSLSLLYWLQTEAPRPDGGVGWPGLRLRGDVLGTQDGFAKRPYIRESRRIRAEVTIAEQDVSLRVRGSRGATTYHESVGVGFYRIDLHPSSGGDSYIDVEA